MRLKKRMTRYIQGLLRKPNLKEQGFANGSLIKSDFAQWPAISDDLVDKKGATVYREVRHDPGVKAALTIKTAGMLVKGWDVVSSVPEDDPLFTQGEAQAEFVKSAFDLMPGSLDDVIEELIRDGLVDGTGIAEKNWRIGETDDGELSGKILPASIKVKDSSLYYFKLDEFKNVTGMQVWASGKKADVDPAKFVCFAWMSEHGNPNGTSDLRAAYRWYWLKSKLAKYWGIFLEKYGSPTAKGSYKRGLPKQQQQDLLSVLDKIQQETSIVVPDDVTVELLTANQQITGGGYKDAIEYCDRQMKVALLGQTLTTGEGDRTGSLALGQVHEDIQDIIIRKLKRKVEECIDEQIIRDLVDFNFAERVYPNFTLTLDEKDISSLSEAIWRLASVEIVDPRESWLREYLGLPAREELPEQEPSETPGKEPENNDEVK